MKLDRIEAALRKLMSDGPRPALAGVDQDRLLSPVERQELVEATRTLSKRSGSGGAEGKPDEIEKPWI